eukprot:gene2972-12979_t
MAMPDPPKKKQRHPKKKHKLDAYLLAPNDGDEEEEEEVQQEEQYHEVGVLNTCVGYVAKSLDYDNETMLNSSVMVGAALGAFTAGMFADALGPKRAQTLNTINFLLGTWLTVTASSLSTGHWGFVAGRVIAGVGAGAASLYAPRYIAEVAPRELRGGLVTQHQVWVNVGLVVAYCMGMPYEYNLVNVNILGKDVPWWRIMITMAFIPAILQLLGLMGCLESPVWLETRDKEAADEVCIQLWGSRAILYEDGEGDEDNPSHSQSTAPSQSHGTYSQSRGTLSPRMLTLALGLPILQQMCGISTVILFSSEVFQQICGMSTVILFS